MVGMPLVMASGKGMPKSLDARRIGKTACQLIEGWQVFVRYLMMEVEKMLNALLLEVGLYLVYIRGSSAYNHHMDFGYIALFLIGFCHLVDFCHSLCHQHQVLALLDASYVEHILVGQLVFLLYLFLFAGLNVLGKDRVAALVHHVYLFPAFIRKNYVQPYALKALPCVLIWFKLVYEMMTKDYSTPQNVSEEK